MDNDLEPQTSFHELFTIFLSVTFDKTGVSDLGLDNTHYHESSVTVLYFGGVIDDKWDFSHSNLPASSVIC